MPNYSPTGDYIVKYRLKGIVKPYNEEIFDKEGNITVVESESEEEPLEEILEEI
jgi:hypothetical protein